MEVPGQVERESWTLYMCNLKPIFFSLIKSDAQLLKKKMKWRKDFLQIIYDMLLAATDESWKRKGDNAYT